MYAGNYDDIINEAVVASVGATDKGWNMVIPNSNYAPTRFPVFTVSTQAAAHPAM